MTDRCIAVVGSANMDLVVQVSRLPRPGETVIGHRHFRNPGGKGANQAVAAARLGAPVAMVGRVGGDDDGAQLLASLSDDGVDTTHVRTGSTPTGLALITVDDEGENAIVVSSGANDDVDADDVDDAGAVIDDAAVCLMQLEIPDATVAEAARRCRGTVLLNPAPARTLSADLLTAVDVLIPNEHELAVLAGDKPDDGVAAAARTLGFDGTIVVTLGAEGAAIVDRDGSTTRVAAPQVEAVDTTAAGDAFCGAVAEALTRGAEIVEAVRWACAAGAAAATSLGAQSSLPTPDDVSALLK